MKQGYIRKLKRDRDEIHDTTAGYNLLDLRRTEDILEEFKVDPTQNNLARWKMFNIRTHFNLDVTWR
jgi:hypothetical protein